MIANVLLEGREHMGLDLGSEIEEALAKDAQKASETLPDFGGPRS